MDNTIEIHNPDGTDVYIATYRFQSDGTVYSVDLRETFSDIDDMCYFIHQYEFKCYDE